MKTHHFPYGFPMGNSHLALRQASPRSAGPCAWPRPSSPGHPPPHWGDRLRCLRPFWMGKERWKADFPMKKWLFFHETWWFSHENGAFAIFLFLGTVNTPGKLLLSSLPPNWIEIPSHHGCFCKSASHSYVWIRGSPWPGAACTAGAACAVFVSLELFGEAWLENCCVFSKNIWRPWGVKHTEI